MGTSKERNKDLLDRAYHDFAHRGFVTNDPISIPHSFTRKEDIEIAGFLTATIAWGNRKSIINNARRLMELVDNSPADFIFNHEPADRKRFKGFVHRTFSEVDTMYFMEALQWIYRSGGLEQAFRSEKIGVKERLIAFRESFFQLEHLSRTTKHVSSPVKNSACKRLNMFLRWMVRSPKEGIDFGIWQSISPTELMIPLDVHTSKVARSLGLLHRKQDDWKSVEELTNQLSVFDQNDPVKYDLALFSLGESKSLTV